MSTLNRIPEFWFERLNKRTRLPMWGAAIVFGTGPFLLLVVIISFVSREPIVDVYSVLVSVLYSLALSISAFYWAKYLRGRVETMMSYAREMMSSDTEVALDLSKLSSTSMIVLVWLVASGVNMLSTITVTTVAFGSNELAQLPYLPLTSFLRRPSGLLVTLCILSQR